MTAVVVTGVGVLSPHGLGRDAHWRSALAGDNGIDEITRFEADGYPGRLAGEVPGFDPAAHVPGRLLPQTDVMTRYSLAAARWALDDADLDTTALSPLDLGVVTAGSAGGFEFGQRELEKLWGRGRRFVSTYMSFAWFYAVNTGQLAIRHDMRGPVGVFVTDDAGGLDAIAHARRKIRKGSRAVLTGAVDSSLCPYGLAAHLASGRLATGNRPDRAYLPFDRAAGGYVPGEGGALLVLESATDAAGRGAPRYGEIAGYGASFDPAPGTGRPSNLRRAMDTALADAGVRPDEVAMVMADGAGTPDEDAAEARAIEEVFGPRGVPVTAPKARTGRLAAGAAPLDVVTALIALREGQVPPTAPAIDVPDHYALDLVTGAPRPVRGRAALVLARGAGGFNSAMVVRR
ncbi:ketosynthase chain-length factor [Micromonospora aurantiaca (nom. illeg.)]